MLNHGMAQKYRLCSTRYIVGALFLFSWIHIHNIFNKLVLYNVIPSQVPDIPERFGEETTGFGIVRDERPISPKGFVCIDGDKGRLNNIIIQVLVGLHFAKHLNRTLLVSEGFAEFYDADRVGLATLPPTTRTSHIGNRLPADDINSNASISNNLVDEEHETDVEFPFFQYRAVLTMKEATSLQAFNLSYQSCPQFNPNPNTSNQSYVVSITDGLKELTIPHRFRAIDSTTSHLPVVTVTNNDIWYWLGRPPEDYYTRFFGGLVPVEKLNRIVDNFVKESFSHGNPHHFVRGGSDSSFTKGAVSPEYVAVHLRNLEGMCEGMGDDPSLCCPSLSKTLSIMKSRNISISLPIFVASDGQCPKEIVEGYRDVGAVMGINHFDDSNSSSIDSIETTNAQKFKCKGTECAVLDFELCSRSSFFIGTLSSSGDMNIREWRTARGHAGNTSVLSLSPLTVEKEGWVAMTRYFSPGYWKWLKDCDEVGSGRARRAKPCV